MSTVAYEIVYVFTDRPFAGNPLAVVYGADDLATDQMLTLAREFNLAETVFVLPPTNDAATYRARIFTTVTELPFAGHPSVGAAVTSMRRGLFPAGPVVQECGAGLLPVEVTAAGAATVAGGEPALGAPLDPGPLLGALSLTPAHYAGRGLAAARPAGCGLDWTFLPVREEALGSCRLDVAAAQESGAIGICVFSWDASAREAHARVFVSGEAVWEHPATGSAALGLVVWLVGSGLLPADGTSS